MIGSESESRSVVSDSLPPHRLYSPWNSPGQNPGVSSLSLLQAIFPTQESNQVFLHCRWILYQLSYQGSSAAAAAAKSLQSCPTLCNPRDGSPPGSLFLGFSRQEHWSGLLMGFLLQCMKVKSESEIAQSYSTLSNPMDCSPPGSSVHGIFQTRVLEWGAIAFSEGSSGCAQKCRKVRTLAVPSAGSPSSCGW